MLDDTDDPPEDMAASAFERVRMLDRDIVYHSVDSDPILERACGVLHKIYGIDLRPCDL